MARFSPGKIHPLIPAFAVPVIVLIFAAIVIVVRGGGKFGDIRPLPYETYLRDAESIRMNSYLVRGEIDRRLSSNETAGAVFAVRLYKEPGKPRIAVLVPKALLTNIEAGQHFDMKVTVRRDALVVDDLEKP